MSLTTYITTWGNDPLYQVQDMFNKGALQSTTRIVLAFASFNFSSTTYIPGFNITIDETKQIVSFVHSKGAKISLSVGGATYPFYGSDLYSRPGDLAQNINTILNNCGFDGVDFDIEDSSANVPSNFAAQAASLINTLKSINPNLYISLTTAAQAWAITCYQQQLINLTIGNLNAWQPMEYDLWIASGSSYYDQIIEDVDFYINTWGVQPDKIVLGLMPGSDDMGRDLTLQDALNITDWALSVGIYNIMTWNANIDSTGIDGNSPYAFSMGIQSMINKHLYY
jgi:chitinase